MPYLETFKEVVNHNLWKESQVLPGEAGCRDIEIMGGGVLLLRSGHDIIRDTILGNLFEDIKGYKKNADWVVFTETLVLICEMKTVEQGEYLTQLKSTKAFVKFLLDKIWLHSEIHAQQPVIKFVLFSLRGNKQDLRNELKPVKYVNDTQLYHLACDSKYNISKFI